MELPGKCSLGSQLTKWGSMREVESYLAALTYPFVTDEPKRPGALLIMEIAYNNMIIWIGLYEPNLGIEQQ